LTWCTHVRGSLSLSIHTHVLICTYICGYICTYIHISTSYLSVTLTHSLFLFCLCAFCRFDADVNLSLSIHTHVLICTYICGYICTYIHISTSYLSVTLTHSLFLFCLCAFCRFDADVKGGAGCSTFNALHSLGLSALSNNKSRGSEPMEPMDRSYSSAADPLRTPIPIEPKETTL